MRKSILLLGGLAACISLAFVRPDAKTLTVVIDAAHGGKDHGATFEGVTEKQITEAIASRIANGNKNTDIRIYFTRTGDNTVGLEERVAFSNQLRPDILVSLHVNGSEDKSKHGLEFYVPNTDHKEPSISYAAQLFGHLRADGHFQEMKVEAGNLWLLKKSETPALVAELGYLSNAGDRAYLASEKGQTEIAESILASLESLK